MSFFTFDETKASTGFELVAEGKYEAVVQNAVAGLTGNKDPKLTIDFEIRSDVNQQHQGAKVMFNTFTFSHEVSVKIVNSLLKATGFAHGHPFKDVADMAHQLIGRHLEITVKHEPYDKVVDGVKKQFTGAKAKYYDVSKAGSPNGQGAPIVVSEEDCPF